MRVEEDSGITRAIASEMGTVEASLSLSQKVLVISEDSLELSVRDGIDNIRKADAWLAPLGIFLSCFIAALTSDFRDKFHVSKETWRAAFILGSFASFVWLARVIYAREHFDHKKFMALVRNKCSKQRIAGAASPAIQVLENAEIPITVEIQCSQCGYSIPRQGDLSGPAICPNCKAAN